MFSGEIKCIIHEYSVAPCVFHCQIQQRHESTETLVYCEILQIESILANLKSPFTRKQIVFYIFFKSLFFSCKIIHPSIVSLATGYSI